MSPGPCRRPQEVGHPRGVGSAVTLSLTIGPMGPVVGQRVMFHDVLQLRVLRVFLREVLGSGQGTQEGAGVV